ncbi:MAG: hypothetical protein RLZZ612_2418 [Pseudomonadota bacterium]|jgi:hypothetical protein
MTDASGQGGFFSRWSKLKAEQRSTPSPLPPQPAAPAPAVRADVTPVLPPTAASVAPLAPQQPVPESQAPSGPTLADVAELTPESDFRPFVARHVVPAVKNAAFKKLFADPHFNIMDGLDIYIDDYSQPSPLLPEDLQQMVAAKFMKLVEDDPPSQVVHTSTPEENKSNMEETLENNAQAATEIEVKKDDAMNFQSNQNLGLQK